LRFAGDVDAIAGAAAKELNAQIGSAVDGDPKNPIDKSKTPLSAWPLNTIKVERDAVKKDVGIDTQKQKKYEDLQKAIAQREASRRKIEADIKRAERAVDSRKELIESRRESYVRVFETIVEEQKVLEELYAPLREVLKTSTGALKKLQFVVKRSIDLDTWVANGEGLLDLRKSSAFQGHGALRKLTAERLVPAWMAGTPEEVGAAVDSFRDAYYKELLKAMPADVAEEQKREWIQSVATWLYGTAHVHVQYGIEYEDVAVEQLSPGTRGIVLLLLYLAVDRQDLRPLIVDQPEENLDPQSVFLELVPHFREARKRRQVIVITHNANLVVNTDADQVIVATSEKASGAGLPTIAYRTGSLENRKIRLEVCEILEGGERAFLERERRYRFRWGEERVGST
jgi:DNA repair exonuclease SbcCD ATPase subunit